VELSVQKDFRDIYLPESVFRNQCFSLSSSKKAVTSTGIFSIVLEDPKVLNVPSLDKNSYNNFIENMGMLHNAVKFTVEQLPGAESIIGKYKFTFHSPHVTPEDTPVDINCSGSARTEGFTKRKPVDMFGWLASRHRQAPTSMFM
jgi:hypothetical protein